ncbi:MAG: purine-binding chemotaxis protein CheW [Candidatus Marinimicrobia bacterium]|nr:purine-binding chemotaxis protein CheW [Candidatus Neomarinimicrobiota bacterium]
MEDTTVKVSDKDQQSTELLQLVGFQLGNEEYGIDILKVQEINRVTDITKIPQSPDFVEGVINLRGNIIPIIDLRKRFHMPEREHDRQTRIVVGEIDDRTVGFIVDAVSEVIRLPLNTVEPPPPIVSGGKAEYIKGVGKLEDRLLMLLDIDKILTGSEKENLFEAAEA